MNKCTSIDNKMQEKKIILLGNSFVGKTSIISKYTKNEFESEYYVTHGIDVIEKETIYDDQPVLLQIFDTCGSDRYTTFLPKSYYRKADGILVVCSINERKSFDDLEMWINNIKENCDNFKNIIIAVNKMDLNEDLHVLKSNELEELSNKYKFSVVSCSAKSNYNIDLAFKLLVEKIFKGDDFNWMKREGDNQKSIIRDSNLNEKVKGARNIQIGRKDPDLILNKSKTKCANSNCCK